MINVGDTINFVPTAYSSGVSNGTDAANERISQCTVKGTVIEVNWAHRWYRVAWKPQYSCVQHECFKF